MAETSETVRGDALERLEAWQAVDENRSCEIKHPGGGNVAHIRLFWDDGRCCHVVTADGNGFMSVDPLSRCPPWHDNDNPADLAATIHAALDAAERAEPELNANVVQTDIN